MRPSESYFLEAIGRPADNAAELLFPESLAYVAAAYSHLMLKNKNITSDEWISL